MSVPPIEPWAPPPMSWKVGSRPDTAAPCDWYQTRPRIDEQAAEGDDERRHADVGDDEALEGADRGAEADPERRARATHWNGTSAPMPKMRGNQSVISSA